MKLQKRIKKQRNEYITIKIPKPDVPKGLFTKCKKCGNMVLSEEVKEKGYVCPKCGEYFRIHAKTRIRMIAPPPLIIWAPTLELPPPHPHWAL